MNRIPSDQITLYRKLTPAIAKTLADLLPALCKETGLDIEDMAIVYAAALVSNAASAMTGYAQAQKFLTDAAAADEAKDLRNDLLYLVQGRLNEWESRAQ